MNNLELRLVVLDLETTNNPERNNKHEIIEVAAMEILGNEINSDSPFHTLVRPPCKIQAHNFKVSGISDEAVKFAPTIDRVLPDLLGFIGDNAILGHNIKFDARVLSEHLNDFEIRGIPNIFLDTLVLSRKLNKKGGSHNLDAVMEKLGIDFSGGRRHRALKDVECTALVFLKFVEILKEYNITTIEMIDRLCNTDAIVEDFLQLELF